MLARGSTRAAAPHPMRALDSVRFPATVDLLKIDVEGMEADVLAGGRTLLRRDRPRIIVEIHGPGPGRAVEGLLREIGYTRVHSGSNRHERQFGIVSNDFWSPGAIVPAEPAQVPGR